MSLIGFVASAVVFAADVTPSQATDELLALLPKQTAAVVVVEDSHGLLERWNTLPFARRLSSTGFHELPGWFDSVDQKWQKFDRELHAGIGMGLIDLNREVFGLSTVLAFCPGEVSKQDSGLMLVRARSEQKLRQVVEHLFQSQRRKPKTRTHAGVEYWVPEDERKACVATLGSIGIATQQEATLKAVIDSFKNKSNWLADPIVGNMRRATKSGAVHVYVLPRQIENRRELPPPKDAGEAMLTALALSYWKSVQWISASAQLEGQPSLSIQFERASTPLADSPSEAAAPVVSPPTARLPGTMAYVTLYCDLRSMAQLCVETANHGNDEEAKKIGRILQNVFWGVDPINKLARSLGPRLGVALTSGDGWVPDLTIAIETQSPTRASADGSAISAARLAEEAARLGLLAIVLDANEKKDSARTASETMGASTLFYATGFKHAPELEPTIASIDGWLLLGSTRNAVRKAISAPPAKDTDFVAMFDLKYAVDVSERAPQTQWLRSTPGWQFAKRFASAFPRITLRVEQDKNVTRLIAEIPEN